MLTLKPLDESCQIHQQLGVDASPVVLVNLFTVAAPEVAALLKAWEADANWMKRQPGYIATQVHPDSLTKVFPNATPLPLSGIDRTPTETTMNNTTDFQRNGNDRGDSIETAKWQASSLSAADARAGRPECGGRKNTFLTASTWGLHVQ